MSRSPIDIMIDQACGVSAKPDKPREDPETEAVRVACETLVKWCKAQEKLPRRMTDRPIYVAGMRLIEIGWDQ